MNEYRITFFVTGPADQLGTVSNRILDPLRDAVYHRGIDGSGRTTVEWPILSKGYPTGFQILEDLVDKYHPAGFDFCMQTYYCGCYWMDYDPPPYSYSDIFGEAYTAIPTCTTSLFGDGQGVAVQKGKIFYRDNRNKTRYEGDVVTEVLFMDRSRGKVTREVVLDTELFLRFYDDGGDGEFFLYSPVDDD